MNEQVIDYTRIKRWHEAGYIGQGCKVALSDMTDADFNPTWFRGVNFVIPESEQYRVNYNAPMNHLGNQIASLLMMAPRPDELHIVDTSSTPKLQYIRDNDIDVYSHSTTHTWNNDEDDALEAEIIEADNVLITASGNESDGGFVVLGAKKLLDGRQTWISIGACMFNPEVVRPQYSSFHETKPYVTALAFSNLEYEGGKTGTGTSFAAPDFAGMYTVWRGAFKKVYGRKPTYAETRAFIKDNAGPVNDNNPYSYGYGAARMPETVLAPPAPVREVIELTVGSKIAKVNGVDVPVSAALRNENGTTKLDVPIREFGTLMGFGVVWNQAAQKVTLTEK